MDFSTTRRIIATLPEWVDEMATLLPRPQKVPVKGFGFRWRHPLETAEVVQVAKAVRMASGITAALQLADAAFTVECGTLLRTVSDFASETIFLAEGLFQGQLNAAQTKFVQDYFKPMPESPDELAERERQYYVGRKDIQKAHGRLVEGAGFSPGDLAKISAYLNKGYDSYVHGAYDTVMELFTGRDWRFMMKGQESQRHQCMSRVSVAGKLYEVLAALEMMAMSRERAALAMKIRQARNDLDASSEQGGANCPEE
jgi:hypothetical protein